MQFKNPHKRNCYVMAISLSLLPMAGTSIAQDQQVEEVVVRFSSVAARVLLKRLLTQLDEVDLEQQGTLNIGEVVQNLTFVNGAASSVTNTIQEQILVRHPSTFKVWVQGPP